MEYRPIEQKFVLMASGLVILNAYYRGCSKLLLDLSLLAEGITITIGIMSTRWLVASRRLVVVLHHKMLILP